MPTKSMSRFIQIASSSPEAKSRQALLERKATQILRQTGFYKPMSEEEKEIRTATERYNLRGYLDPSRS